MLLYFEAETRLLLRVIGVIPNSCWYTTYSCINFTVWKCTKWLIIICILTDLYWFIKCTCVYFSEQTVVYYDHCCNEVPETKSYFTG